MSLQGDLLPGVRGDDGDARRMSELRARVVFDDALNVGEHVRLTASVFAEGLVADRARQTTSRDAILRPQELHAELRWQHADLRVGFTRIVWGRLDEFLPTDVVNPQDISRFFFEGRSDGRMPVAMVRGRWLPSDRYSLEGILAPVFRAGRFDQLEEPTSPFNLAPEAVCGGPEQGTCLPIVVDRHEPSRSWRHAQGGGRFSATSGRVDWSISAYRGFEPLPLYSLRTPAVPTIGVPLVPPGVPPAIGLDARFPRFTMIGGDFETVRGAWGLRGEVATFPERSLQIDVSPFMPSPVSALGIDGARSSRRAGSFPARAALKSRPYGSSEPLALGPSIIAGQAIEAGVGVDRKAGAYRLSGNIVVTRQWADEGPSDANRSDVTFVAAADRSFARDTRRVRLLGVYDPSDETAFVRAIGEWSVRDNVTIEASGGVFSGDGLGRLGRLATRDFVYLRLKVFY